MIIGALIFAAAVIIPVLAGAMLESGVLMIVLLAISFTLINVLL